MVANIIPIGKPVNDSERKAIQFLRDNLPDTYTIIHNFEIPQSREKYEIDLAIIAPHSVFVVDIKGISGLIDIHGSTWYPQGRASIFSPLPKLRQHAKILKSLICDSHPAKTDLNKIHVHAVILMTAPNSQVEAHGSVDGDDITYLNQQCLTYFKGKTHIPNHRSSDIRSLNSYILPAIQGKAKPISAPQSYRDWQIEEELAEVPNRYKEYRAKNIFIGKRGGVARLRVYEIDPYQEPSDYEAQKQLISNAFRSVAHMQPHPNILAVREFFANEAEDRLILVTEDIPGQPLRQHINKPDAALTFDQKISVIRDILSALDHAHKCEVIHRNLNPDAILVDGKGQARITAFDYARVTKSRSSTIAEQIIDDLDPNFQAPECYREPSSASIASDLFSTGLICYELLTGVTAFKNASEIFDCDAIFPNKPSSYKPDLPPGIDEWLQRLCVFDPEDRFPSAAVALLQLDNLIYPGSQVKGKTSTVVTEESTLAVNLLSLPKDYILGDRFIVQEILGKGGFGVAYKVFDSMSDTELVMKIIFRDKQSVYQRLKREYKTLRQIPEHPNIVKVVWADKLPDDTPYIVFDYVDGLDVEKLLESEALSLEDVGRIARDTIAGLVHLHQHGVYHQDIKPSNLLLTDKGIRIIDFNVAVTENDEQTTGGGTRRYIPPDFDFTLALDQINTEEKSDRDLYALGITLYECVTGGQYPFEPSPPTPGQTPRNPHEFPGCEDLSRELVQVLLKAISPHRANRFSSAREFENAINSIKNFQQVSQTIELTTETLPPTLTNATKPNFNPFVSHLLTLYSQSQQSNAGTRGLDVIGELTYVPTLLDKALQPAILAGEFSLVIVSGNAGDGKTAFIQKLEKQAQTATIQRKINGSEFHLNSRKFFTNYDGSQDEGDKVNDEVLLEFFAPFTGNDETAWTNKETRLIAINEGRLVDFLSDHTDRFPKLTTIVRNGLKGGDLEHSILVINLNLRSIVADLGQENNSIFDQLIRHMTQPQLWQACGNCDLKDRCYIYHNARTFMDGKVGAKVIERLKTLYTITHLRGRLHITLRDLRSALAFMLAGTRDCDRIHELYRSSTPEARQEILDGFYFNAWMGGSKGSADRLISLLREVDVGETSDPNLDRSFAFLEPTSRKMGRFGFSERERNDDFLLEKVYLEMRSEFSGQLDMKGIAASQNYVAMLRRRHYFERRDTGWELMLPYGHAKDFQALVEGDKNPTSEIQPLLNAINQGEGLRNPGRLGNSLALLVRQVNRGTIRSYRLFDGAAFSLSRSQAGSITRFIEYLPQILYLRYYSTGDRHNAELNINLDVYEMLKKLDRGYYPSAEEQQGLYRSLAVFKNLLASAPYQEVLLTETGQEFYRIRRDINGRLTLDKILEETI
jgi:serine/threonine protein kinase